MVIEKEQIITDLLHNNNKMFHKTMFKLATFAAIYMPVHAD